jgi:hypothetical protein
MTPRTGPIADYYAQDCGLPIAFRELVKGFWLVDRLQFEESLVYICHPLVEDTYREQVMTSYLRAAGPNSHEFVLAYILAKTPRLTTSEQTAVFVESLCRASVIHGLDYARKVSPDRQRDVFAQLVTCALAINPKKNLWRLANASLSPAEAALLNEVLEQVINKPPDAKSASLARDVLLMQSISTGADQQARRIASKASSSGEHAVGPVSRQDIAVGLRIAAGP